MSPSEHVADPSAATTTDSFEVATTDGGTLRAVIRRGGIPTPVQTAAVAAALMTAGGADGPTVDATRRPGWQSAALREGIGAARITDRADLRRPHGPV